MRKREESRGPWIRGMASHRRGRPTALVTGANRGLGLETSRQLHAAGFQVILTSRDETSGAGAAHALDPRGSEVLYHPLDVADSPSVAALVQDLPELAPRLDVLVNNAGVGSGRSDVESAKRTMAVNYEGPRNLVDALVPFVPRSGRIVNVSSGMGELTSLGRGLRPRFEDPALTRAALDGLVDGYLADVARGDARRVGWPSPYSVSKVALNALTRILARELAARGIAVNAVCPGWVRTDMGGRSAPRSVAVGARSIVQAVQLAPEATGGFYRDGRAIPW